MMSASCTSAAALVVVTLTGCGSSGPGLFNNDGIDVDRSLVATGTDILEVTGAADTQINGMYDWFAGEFWKNQETGARVRLHHFGAGLDWCCPANSQVWWMGYDGSGKYFNCAEESVPPLSGWQARDRPGFDWSEEFGSGSVPQLSPKYLEATDAADGIFNGIYQLSADGIWRNFEKGTRMAAGTFGAGKAWACPSNSIVWWMRDTASETPAKYFNCATGDLPPLSGWQARDQNHIAWSIDFASQSVPTLTFVFRPEAGPR